MARPRESGWHVRSPGRPLAALAAAGIFACGAVAAIGCYLEIAMPFSNPGTEINYGGFLPVVVGLGALLGRFTTFRYVAILAALAGTAAGAVFLSFGGATPLNLWRWAGACDAGDRRACAIAAEHAPEPRAALLRRRGCDLRDARACRLAVRLDADFLAGACANLEDICTEHVRGAVVDERDCETTPAPCP